MYSEGAKKHDTRQKSGDTEYRAPVPVKSATLTISSVGTALVLIIFTVPLTTLTGTAHALGANNTARYLGSATGLTVCVVAITHAGAASGVAKLLSGWNSAVLVTAGFSLLGALAVYSAGERFAFH